MDKISLVIKSYIPDAIRALRCVQSIHRHNKDNIPVYLLIKRAEESKFKEVFGDTKVNIIHDETITTTPTLPGWLYQQIIKSQFWVTGLSENYVTVDSDTVFFKDFYESDFMYDDNTPYIVMGERKDFLDEAWKLNRVGIHQDMKGRDMYGARITNCIKRIREIIPNNINKFYDYGTSPYIFNSTVWRHFRDNYLVPNNLSFTNFSIILNNEGKMSESTIYGEYYLYSNLKKIMPISPLVKCYHDRSHWEFDKKHNIDIEDLKPNYIGYILQSNWSEEDLEL